MRHAIHITLLGGLVNNNPSLVVVIFMQNVYSEMPPEICILHPPSGIKCFDCEYNNKSPQLKSILHRSSEKLNANESGKTS
jgi:hypothetical protein